MTADGDVRCLGWHLIHLIHLVFFVLLRSRFLSAVYIHICKQVGPVLSWLLASIDCMLVCVCVCQHVQGTGVRNLR